MIRQTAYETKRYMDTCTSAAPSTSFPKSHTDQRLCAYRRRRRPCRRSRLHRRCSSCLCASYVPSYLRIAARATTHTQTLHTLHTQLLEMVTCATATMMVISIKCLPLIPNNGQSTAPQTTLTPPTKSEQYHERPITTSPPSLLPVLHPDQPYMGIYHLMSTPFSFPFRANMPCHISFNQCVCVCLRNHDAPTHILTLMRDLLARFWCDGFTAYDLQLNCGGNHWRKDGHYYWSVSHT